MLAGASSKGQGGAALTDHAFTAGWLPSSCGSLWVSFLPGNFLRQHSNGSKLRVHHCLLSKRVATQGSSIVPQELPPLYSMTLKSLEADPVMLDDTILGRYQEIVDHGPAFVGKLKAAIHWVWFARGLSPPCIFAMKE